MDWFITHKPAYDADFVELSKTLQKQATQAHAELARAPATPRGNTVKPLKGWKNLWRYRMGDYRLIYSVVLDSHVVQLLAIGPRKDVYDRFKYDPEAEEMPTSAGYLRGCSTPNGTRPRGRNRRATPCPAN